MAALLISVKGKNDNLNHSDEEQTPLPSIRWKKNCRQSDEKKIAVNQMKKKLPSIRWKKICRQSD